MQFVMLTARCGRSLRPLYQLQVDKTNQVDYDDYNYDVVYLLLFQSNTGVYLPMII